MNVYSRFWPYMKPYWLRFIQAAVAMAVVALFNGAFVALLKDTIDYIFIAKDMTMLWLAIIGVPTVFGIKTMAAYIQNYLMSWIGQKITQEIREDLFRHLHALNLSYYAENRSGDILARVTNDLQQVQSTMHFIPLYVIRDSLTILVLVTIMFWLNWRFALLAITAVPLASLILVVFGRKMRESSRQSQLIMGHIYDRFQESLQGMMVIKAFNFEQGAIEKFQRENDSFFEQMMRYLRATALSGPLMEFVGALVAAGLLYYGGKENIAGRMTPGAFIAFLTAFFSAYNPTKNLAKLNSELQRGLASGERIFQLLDEKPTIVETPNARRFDGLKDRIRIEGVSFRYAGREAYAAKDLDLRIAKGEVVAIAGPSGSGKSTLVQLLLRLYDPQKGRILFDGVDLRDLNVHSFREQIGLVSQDTILFNDTVFNNLVLGRKGVDQAQVRHAAEIADAARFISELPQGYDTILGERGMKLSGGQRQRLAIARAVIKNPSILILDEATSSLDSASEEAVQKAIERLMEGRTVLVIAHRLSTIAMAHKIYVLSQGELIEEGDHRQLMERNGLYRRLYEIQKAEPAASPVQAA